MLKPKTIEPIVIVGSGPVGVYTAILLKKLGISITVLERQTVKRRHPQAHFLNTRTMEILQDTIPSVHTQIQKLATPLSQWRHFEYCSSFSGPCIARIDQWVQKGSIEQISPTEPVHFPQDVLEELLEDHATEMGIPILRGLDVTGVDVTTENDKKHPIELQMRQIQSPNQAYRNRCKMLIAADGASSTIRQSLGIRMVGDENLQQIINIHFSSKQLGELISSHPAMLYFVYNPEVIGVLIAHNVPRGEFVFQIPLLPPHNSLGQFSQLYCVDLISKAAGLQISDLQIHSVGQWTMNSQVAEKYHVPVKHGHEDSGNIFLVGDSAHQFPPAGGFGLNTGIQDAHNLAWKILANQSSQMNKKYCPEHFHYALDSYDRERRSVGVLNARLSMRNFQRTLQVPKALGLSPELADVALKAQSHLASWLPKEIATGLSGAAFSLGRTPLAAVADLKSPIGNILRNSAKNVIENRESLGLLFFPYDLGFSYSSNSLQQLSADLTSVHNVDKGILTFINRIEEGARLPHCWLQPAQVNVQEKAPKRVSSIQLMTHMYSSASDGDAMASTLKDEATKSLCGMYIVPAEFSTSLVKLACTEDLTSIATNVLVAVIGKENESTVQTKEECDSILSNNYEGNYLRLCHFVADHSQNPWLEDFQLVWIRPDGHVGKVWKEFPNRLSFSRPFAMEV